MDKVEDSNLNRQFFYETDIGKYKSASLKEKLLKINKKIKIDALIDPVQKTNKDHFNNIQLFLIVWII